MCNCVENGFLTFIRASFPVSPSEYIAEKKTLENTINNRNKVIERHNYMI